MYGQQRTVTVLPQNGCTIDIGCPEQCGWYPPFVVFKHNTPSGFNPMQYTLPLLSLRRMRKPLSNSLFSVVQDQTEVVQELTIYTGRSKSDSLPTHMLVSGYLQYKLLKSLLTSNKHVAAYLSHCPQAEKTFGVFLLSFALVPELLHLEQQ